MPFYCMIYLNKHNIKVHQNKFEFNKHIGIFPLAIINNVCPKLTTKINGKNTICLF